jgi:hypothetical protein
LLTLFQLFYGILEKQAIENTKVLTMEAQISAERMEVMVKSMQELAKKTKDETGSMKVITLVTLFFLPGTFISVSRFQTTQNIRQLYLNRSLTLTYQHLDAYEH